MNFKVVNFNGGFIIYLSLFDYIMSFKVTHTPNEVIGICSNVDETFDYHFFMMDCDKTPVSKIKNWISKLERDIRELGVILIVRSSLGSYHIVSPAILNCKDFICYYTILKTDNDYNHLSAGLKVGRWTLRVTPKRNKKLCDIKVIDAMCFDPKGAYLYSSSVLNFYSAYANEQIRNKIKAWMKKHGKMCVETSMMFDRYKTT